MSIRLTNSSRVAGAGCVRWHLNSGEAQTPSGRGIPTPVYSDQANRTQQGSSFNIELLLKRRLPSCQAFELRSGWPLEFGGGFEKFQQKSPHFWIGSRNWDFMLTVRGHLFRLVRSVFFGVRFLIVLPTDGPKLLNRFLVPTIYTKIIASWGFVYLFREGRVPESDYEEGIEIQRCRDVNI